MIYCGNICQGTGRVVAKLKDHPGEYIFACCCDRGRRYSKYPVWATADKRLFELSMGPKTRHDQRLGPESLHVEPGDDQGGLFG